MGLRADRQTQVKHCEPQRLHTPRSALPEITKDLLVQVRSASTLRLKFAFAVDLSDLLQISKSLKCCPISLHPAGCPKLNRLHQEDLRHQDQQDNRVTGTSEAGKD